MVSRKYSPRQSLKGLSGLSLSRNPRRKEGVKSRKQRGKPNMTRREYNYG